MRHPSYLVLALAVTASFSTACGSSGSNEVTGLCAENGVTTFIVDNHPNGSHTLVIPIADVAAAVEVTYDIQGNNTGHGHSVTVTADDFVAIDVGTVVTLESSDTGAVGQDHTHPVTISCNPQT